MPRILFSLCLLVWLGVPAPAVRAAPPADYFPLVPGTVWIYRTNIGQDLIMTVGGVGQVGGGAWRGGGGKGGGGAGQGGPAVGASRTGDGPRRDLRHGAAVPRRVGGAGAGAVVAPGWARGGGGGGGM